MDVINRLESHWLACMAAVGGGGQVTRLEGAIAVANPAISGASFNFITLRRASPVRLVFTLELGAAILAGHGRPPALFLSPLAGDMPALTARLTEMGWRPSLAQVVLVADLPAAGLVHEADIAVAEIGPDQLPLWGSTLVAAYEVAPPARAEIARAWSSLHRQPGEGARARLYLAYKETLPVGTGLSWGQGEIGGLYCGAVLPQHRRQGVETATLIRRMADLAADGRRLVTLQTEAGSPVARLCQERLGFTTVYQRELWLPCG